MKYRLLKDLPGVSSGTAFKYTGSGVELVEGTNIGGILDFINGFGLDNDFFEPIVDKKKFEDLKKGDIVYHIGLNGEVYRNTFFNYYAKTGTFLTKHDAEMERLRREARANVYLPKKGETFFYYDFVKKRVCPLDYLFEEDYHIGNCHATAFDAEEYGYKYAKAFEIPNE